MMVTFVSQCEKNALKKTRRVLDAFANRIGDNTWQTVITNDGLQTVKKLLRKTASKKTAVSCFWLRSRSRSELVWVVGNRNKFDEQGVVPVNTTKKNHRHLEWERGWLTTEVIAIASGIAGLFHDVGKANDLFQNKLNPKIKAKNFELYRHEWVSLRLFQAFVDRNSDEEWIIKLANVDAKVEEEILHRLVVDKTQSTSFNNPFDTLPEFARLVAWLIVSHHRLPAYPREREVEPSLSNIDNWMSEGFDNLWNSENHLKPDWTKEQIKSNWSFSSGTPFRSETWQQKAVQISKRAVRCVGLVRINWFDKPFVMHISRLTLMLSDHCYSAGGTTVQWQDSNYQAYANTDKNRHLKQKLDEHNVAVGHYAYLFSRSLPRFRDELPCISDNRVLRKGLGREKEFQWQGKAYQTAVSIQNTAQTQGFFGINMASTGKGKTIANARIMYGLSDDKEGCRISIALGLRTLTLQTGKALKKRLDLDEGDIATLIGSQAVLKLSQINQEDKKSENRFSSWGSESLDLGADGDGYEVIYDIDTYEGLLDKWFKNNPKNQKLLHAPILVSTIDHLTPATEGVRGGRQIVPMLRLLTSDLILDEPDEFDLNDLPALARLVNWAGMLGAKVLLSTATMPPALAYGLFEAYQKGRKSYQAATSSDQSMKPIVCAWFDELNSQSSEHDGIQSFIKTHDEFVSKRIKGLEKTNLALRKAQLLDIPVLGDDSCWSSLLGEIIQKNMTNLHATHHEKHESGKKVSIGLVRMANINPLVAVAKELYKREVPKNYKIHYCVYHSQYPLAQRSLIEDKLDQVLDRKNPQAIWHTPDIKQALVNCSEQNHLFVVLATSVAEVGRDHDYDWAIAEPSSMRSIIQLAGRIQRHRKQEPKEANLYILNKNIKALRGEEIAFAKPGFEANNRKLNSHDLHDILEVCQYDEPDSKPSIQIPEKFEKQAPFSNLAMMEHMAYREKLLGDNKQENNARLWWKNKVSWCAELQRRQPFRASSPDQAYCLCIDEDSDELAWEIKNENVSPVEYEPVSDITPKEIEIDNGNQPWFDTDIKGCYKNLSEKLGISLKNTSHCFGEVRLREYQNQDIRWHYSPLLGIFREA